MVGGILVVSEINPAWLDALVSFTFDATGLPPGNLLVQNCLGSDYGNWVDRMTVSVDFAEFRDDMVFTNQNNVIYRMRFVSGVLTGPFSGELEINL
jgi:hypothetical protein